MCAVDTASSEASSIVCSRLYCEECGNSLHAFPGSQYVSDFHECLHFGGLADSQEAGRNAQDMEGTCSRVTRYKTRLSSGNNTQH
jgi:hypothetical protein